VCHTDVLEYALDQRRHVARSIAKRREIDPHRRKTTIEIGAEPVVVHVSVDRRQCPGHKSKICDDGMSV
jgi:hypothetical protein